MRAMVSKSEALHEVLEDITDAGVVVVEELKDGVIREDELWSRDVNVHNVDSVGNDGCVANDTDVDGGGAETNTPPETLKTASHNGVKKHRTRRGGEGRVEAATDKGKSLL